MIESGKLRWFTKNGGGSEGIILCMQIDPIPQKGREHIFFVVDEKSEFPDTEILAESLLSATVLPTGEILPRFLSTDSIPAYYALGGLHLSDYRGLIKDPSNSDGLFVRNKGFHVIDIIRVYPSPDGKRRFIVDSKKGKGETKIVEVVEDWQLRLRKASPFQFNSWFGVLDVIASEQMKVGT